MPKKSPGTVLVTGGAQRIGKAISLSLASTGYNVAIHYRDSGKEAQAFAREIKKLGVACDVFQAELSNENEVIGLVQEVKKRFPNLNVLVNNASIFKKSDLNIESLPLLEEHWQVNFKAPYILTCEFARLCKKGNIINILDTHIIKNDTPHAAYLLSKKLLAQFTKMAALQLAPHIRVNGIAPGPILPPIDNPSANMSRMAQRVPLKKKGSVDYITSSIKFLLENEFVTGQIIFADGGEHLI